MDCDSCIAHFRTVHVAHSLCIVSGGMFRQFRYVLDARNINKNLHFCVEFECVTWGDANTNSYQSKLFPVSTVQINSTFALPFLFVGTFWPGRSVRADCGQTDENELSFLSINYFGWRWLCMIFVWSECTQHTSFFLSFSFQFLRAIFRLGFPSPPCLFVLCVLVVGAIPFSSVFGSQVSSLESRRARVLMFSFSSQLSV